MQIKENKPFVITHRVSDDIEMPLVASKMSCSFCGQKCWICETTKKSVKENGNTEEFNVCCIRCLDKLDEYHKKNKPDDKIQFVPISEDQIKEVENALTLLDQNKKTHLLNNNN